MSGPRPLLVVGDTLLDRDVEGAVERLAPDAPVPVLDEIDVESRPGGAGLAAMLAAADGRDVTLLTALGRDGAAAELAAALEAGGVEVVDLGLAEPTPEKVRFRSSGRSLLRLDRGGRAGATPGACTAAARAAVEWADAVLVSDYGRGLTADPELREALGRHAERAPLVWDPHPRGAAPVAGAWLATPNESEATRMAETVAGEGMTGAARRAETLARRWAARAVCVTRAGEGAVLVRPGTMPMTAPAVLAASGDACGAGDRFAATAAGLMADGAEAADAVVEAVSAASTFVAAGGASAARLGRGEPVEERRGHGLSTASSAATRETDPLAVAADTRSRGGAVVATGGCFDLLHTGHVRTLEAARALGDCLIVLVNSDASVARLKGPGRPLVPGPDRAAVLLALECVDAVMVFDEDTPEAALERLRPDVFAKGGDYALAELPERAVLEQLGGRAVTLPYFEGHSTTRLIQEVGIRAED